MGATILTALLTEVLIPVVAVVGILFALVQWLLVSKVKLSPEKLDSSKDGVADDLIEEEEGLNDHNVVVKCAEIQNAISEGATSFLLAEYRYVGIFMVVFAVLIFLFLGSVEGFSTTVQPCPYSKDKYCKPALANAGFSTISFLLGAITSLISGFLGMKIATYANARTTLEARKGVGKAFIIAFRSGAVMGFLLAANGLLVLYIAINLFKLYYGDDWEGLFESITGYGLGGSSMALFGRVGGGIYTKAADVGADLVGKVERNIPEDDPRNPAVIADNVGDNVGDIAGMGSDLFGSYAESSCAALVVASISSFGVDHDFTAMCYPLLTSSMGIVVCLITTLFATDFFEIKDVKEIEPALKKQLIISTALMTIGIAIISWIALPSTFTIFSFGEQKQVKNWELFFCVAIGLWAGLVIGFVTEYYTSNAYSPVQVVADSCRTGAATNVIFGLALGYKSVIIPIFAIAVSIFVSFSLAAMYGIAVAALGMLSTIATGLAIDAYGPISDNAGGIAEMAGMSHRIRERTDALDAAGNTTAAIGKGVGQKVGTEIWRIENFQPVPLPKSDCGKFHTGDSYIILQTTSGKGGTYLYDIHFWIGKESSQDEAGTAAIKTVELDAVLGGRAVQHRELQGFESDKFLSYFKPCIIPLEGGVASGFKKPEEEKFETRLYVCKGKRVVRMKQVPFARSSLNHDDVFILDTETKIYQFNGANSNIQERAKALEVVQYLKDNYHEGTCAVAIIDDGKFQAESDSGEFWLLFGGFAPIGKKVVSEDDIVLEATPAKLYSINDGQLTMEESTLSKAMLENYKCYLLDCGAEIFVWVGRVTQIEERKAASKAAEDFITSQNRPKSTHITLVIQGYEPLSFKSNFESWPTGTVTGTGTSSGEEGRGKVAALLKQQGVDFKGISKGSQTNEEVPPLLESGGKLEVWRINGSAKTPVPKEEIGKFYSGDCYIVLYTYHSGEKKEDYFLACWTGKASIQDDQIMATRLANTMWNSLKGRPVQGRIFEGKEPPQFIALFQPMVVLKGGISSGYKKLVADKNLTDETYTSEGIALIQVSGTSVHNNKAVQVDAVAASLSSTDCFLLQSGNSLFIWNGSSCTFEQQQWAVRLAELLKPGVALKHIKEGTESSAFWFALGGKQSFTSKKITQDIVRDPHLYSFLFKKGKLEVSEIFNYSQDDLLTEDILILDTHAEVFVWIGQSVDSKEKQKTFDLGQKYIELAMALEGLPADVPLYRITEGNEPYFFTTYFSWDSAKATVQGNSFQKKLSHIFGAVMLASEFKSAAAHHDGPTQRASALKALSSAFSPSNTKTTSPKPSRPSQGSQRAAAVAALSSVLTAEQKKGESETTTTRISRSPSPAPPMTVNDSANVGSMESNLEDSIELSGKKEPTEGEGSIFVSNGEDSEVAQHSKLDENGGETTFSYERLKAKSSNPVRGIDYKQREAYLSEAEFEKVLGMTKEAFYQQPKWKQDMQKRKVDLF